MAKLRDEVAEDGPPPPEDIRLLGGAKRDAVQQLKEWKEAAKKERTALSPRSQQLRAAREQAEALRREEQQRAWRQEEETGRRWTAARWLASRELHKVVASALQLPALSADGNTQVCRRPPYRRHYGSESASALTHPSCSVRPIVCLHQEPHARSHPRAHDCGRARWPRRLPH